MTQKNLIDYNIIEVRKKTLSEIQENISRCCECEICDLEVNKFYPEKGFGRLPIKRGIKKVLLVGINPSVKRFADSMFVGAFTGRTSGDLLQELLEQAGIKKDELYITNLVRCSTPANSPLKEKYINNCKDYLFEEIRLIQPKVIVSLGKCVIDFLKEHRDFIKTFCSCDFIFLEHPNTLKYNPEKKEKYLKELSKIKGYL